MTYRENCWFVLNLTDICMSLPYTIPFTFFVLAYYMQATNNPSSIYYDYSSSLKRYALYEVRTGVSASERIYLRPFKLSGVPPPRDKIIRGTLMDPSSAVPDEAFVFQVFQASVAQSPLVPVGGKL